MTTGLYPIALDVRHRPCLVVGGGTIATDKVEGLLHARAQVTVVSPAVSPEIAERTVRGEITWHRRAYRMTDLDGIFLAYGATGDLAINAWVVEGARERGILANAVDDPPNCDFYAVAITRRGELQVSVSTGGHSPAFARWVREYLDDWLPAEFEDLLSVLAQVRREVHAAGQTPPYEVWRDAIDDEVLLRLRHGDREGAYRQVRAAVLSVNAVGAVTPARWSA